jgi:hypothetical protein
MLTYAGTLEGCAVKMVVIFRSHARNYNAALIKQKVQKTSALPQHDPTIAPAGCSKRRSINGHRLLHHLCPHAKSGALLGDAPA